MKQIQKYADMYKLYKQIVKLINKYEDKIDIYIDEPSGFYIHKVMGDATHNFVDNIESDGDIYFDPSSTCFQVEDASCVVIKTFDNREKVDKKIGTNYGKISLIINSWGLGILQSVLLSENKMEKYNNLMSGKYTKGTLDEYEFFENEGHTAIIPVIDKFEDYVGEIKEHGSARVRLC